MENQALSMIKQQLKGSKIASSTFRRRRTNRPSRRNPVRLERRSLQSKDMALSSIGAMADLERTAAGDEILKIAFANVAFENFEIAADESRRSRSPRRAANAGARVQANFDAFRREEQRQAVEKAPRVTEAIEGPCSL
jgi:hypothetical protein